MTVWETILSGLDIMTRETALFACIGFLIGGTDDLVIDLLYWTGLAGRKSIAPDIDAMAQSDRRLAIFVPAWDESAVIASMLRTARRNIRHRNYALYVGTYPNDRATIDAVAAFATVDPHIRLVIADHPGPTTKADCLNSLWRALERDVEAGEAPVAAIILHDAEDVVHPRELCVHAALIGDYDLIQTPVIPLMDARSPFVAGHYCDEFAESHAKQMTVRGAIGAAIPLAGVGCAIGYAMLRRIADDHGGAPFDAESLTEDYELGLKIKRLNGRAIFARIREHRGGPPIGTRAYFPARLDAAVRQKARWMIGIALAGWDRIGWASAREFADHWMRMRDRRALLAVIVLAAAYIALVAGFVAQSLHWLSDIPAPAPDRTMRWLLIATTLVLTWRLAMRALFVQRLYGWKQALLSLPRAVTGNAIALLAARRAITRYIGMLRGKPLRWDKTAHHFPENVEGEATA
ncbi:hypothetical protein GCM10023219_22000 [Stakelama sediminis]|uniref:Adsorption protein B n=1 Tax=Stakelama sediminis TaxID=463200 RepID=A0A840YZV9_9SPHN|nr:glycosyl transferase family protein [Stakelama sediminis]MBB5719155.1 adsorption protein B [Stakelama sediminis]